MKRLKHLSCGKKILAVIGIILLAFIVFVAISAIIIRVTSTEEVVQIFFQTQEKYIDEDACTAYIEKCAVTNAKDYELPTASKLFVESEVVLTEIEGVQAVVITPENTFSEIVETGDAAISADTTETIINAEDVDNVIVFVHGGAYFGNLSNGNIRYCDLLCGNTGATIIIPIYSLAPVSTYETAYEEMHTVWNFVQETYTNAQIDMIGSSAGGGLSAGFCEDLALTGGTQPDHLILYSPWVDITMSNEDIADYEEADRLLAPYGLKRMGAIWAGDTDTTDYHVSPIYGDLSGLQNVTIFVGTNEIFYPDDELFSEKLDEAGVDVTFVVGEDMWHVYPLYATKWIPEALDAFDITCETILGTDFES